MFPTPIYPHDVRRDNFNSIFTFYPKTLNQTSPKFGGLNNANTFTDYEEDFKIKILHSILIG